MERVLVFFVEGDSEILFYQKIINYLKERHEKSFPKVELIGLKGIGNFKSKAVSRFKNYILPKYKHYQFVVFLAYDTDVFEFCVNPPINWSIVESELRSAGAKQVIHLRAEKMIEDWFIVDTKSICESFDIKVPKKIYGDTGLEKIKTLFKKANKIYQKGFSAKIFIDHLNISLIYKTKKIEFDKIINNL